MDVPLNLAARRRIETVMQDEAAECGLACLAMVASFYGHASTMPSLRRRFPGSLKGLDLASMTRIAEAMHLQARPIRVDMEELEDCKLPLILHWDFNHFTVLSALRRGRYFVNDPATGARWHSSAEMSSHFTGVAVEIVPSARFAPKRSGPKLGVSALWRGAPGITGPITQIIALSCVAELASLAAPFLLQISIDEVAPSGDANLLTSLAIGFLLVAIIGQIATLARSWVSAGLSGELGYWIVSNVFRHMIRLQPSWFERRTAGDILTRFNASQPIVDLISKNLFPAVIDGAMGVATLIIMFYYSALLTFLCLGAVFLYIVLRLSYIGVLRSRSMSVVRAQAKEQTFVLETIRGIVPVKLANRAIDRLHAWQARRVSVVKNQVAVSRLQSAFEAGNSTTIAIENVIFVYLAMRLNIANAMTIGMITAFAAYKQQFISASLNVTGRLIDYALLDVQVRRLSDIVLSPPEQVEDHQRQELRLRGDLHLDKISFSYDIASPPIIRCAELIIREGETVVITGPSGSGKSTLLKLILGLQEPSAGCLTLGGVRVTSENLECYRSGVAAVLQDDTLFAGTISENISFFDRKPDVERIVAAARDACVDEEISSFTMKYESLVGDMGSTLSGGQRQRILLARALYREPRILVMDEATANLDLDLEKKVNAMLKSMKITRVVVSHRRETIRMADRRLRLRNGKLFEVDIVAPSQSRDALSPEYASS